MEQPSIVPPPLPPRRPTGAMAPASSDDPALITPVGSVMEGPAILDTAPQSDVPPPLPPRQPRMVSSDRTVLPPAIEMPMPISDTSRDEASEAGPSQPRHAQLVPLAVNVTPATPEILSPSSPVKAPSYPSRLRSPAETAASAAARTPSPPRTPPAAAPLPEPPNTAPATLAVPSSTHTLPQSEAPPPLPLRPSTIIPGGTPATLPGFTLDASQVSPNLTWIGATVFVAILAYFRLVSIWVLVLGIGIMGMLQPKTASGGAVEQEQEGSAGGGSRSAVSWVNHVLYALFPLISTDVLTPFIDLLEDALIQQVPPMVTSVRLEAPALGNQPLLLTSLRPMTDEEWFASVSTPSPTATTSKHASSLGATTGSGHRKSVSTKTLGDLVRGKTHRRGRSEGSSAAAFRDDNRAKMTRSASNSSVGDVVDSGTAQEETDRRRRRDRILRTAKKQSRESMRDAASSAVPTTGATLPPHLGSEVAAGGGPTQTPALAETDHAGQAASQIPPGTSVSATATPGEMDEDDPLAGQYVNFQVGFEYRRKEETKNRKGYGLHVLGYFGIGVKGLGTTELPVYIDMLAIKGILNLRLLLSATPPFARTATISFPRLPEFDISAKPLTRSTFNAMSLPGMKPYVQTAIASVARIFVRPESYTLDVDRLLLGREAAYRTSSIGVLHIIIHSAEGLPKVDTVGTCDPYVAVGFAKYHKPTFSTRTIIDNQNPNWEEPAFVLVTSDEIESGESLRLRVCDADRFSADDAVGVVQVELADLIEETSSLNEPQRRTDQLQADRPGMRVSGSLTWSVRFAPLWQMSQEELHRRRLEMKLARKGDCNEPKPQWLEWIERFVGDKPSWAADREARQKETASWFTGERERDEMEVMAKPSEEFRSGVLQFHIHQCTDLEIESQEGTYSAKSSARKSAAGGPPALADLIDRTATENPEPPSAYVEVHLNDRMVFRTRTKQLTPLPYFNAVSERFLRDWRMAKLVFVVRDERDREHDAILGIVTLRLDEAFRENSQFTRWYPIVGGLGWGRIRISLLWKPIDITLPPRISAFEVGTLQIKSISATDLSHLADKKGISVLLETEADKFVLSSETADSAHPGRTSMSAPPTASPRSSSFPTSPKLTASPAPRSPGLSSAAGLDDTEMEWDITRLIRLAVEYRHSCHVLVSFITRTGVVRKKKVVGLASVRLNDVEDNTDIAKVVPIFATSSVKEAIVCAQAYAETQAGGLALVRTPTRQVPLIGFVSLEMNLRPGVSKAHRKLAKKDLRFKRVYEAWEADREVRMGLDKLGARDVVREWGLGDQGGEGESDDDESETDGEVVAADGKRVSRSSSHRSMGASSQISGVSGISGVSRVDGDDEVDEGDEGYIQKRMAHSRALHKRHKGIFQLKIARTGKFVKDMVEAKLYARATDRRMRGADLDVEQEGQSKL